MCPSEKGCGEAGGQPRVPEGSWRLRPGLARRRPSRRRGDATATLQEPVARVVGGDPSGPRPASAAAAREEQPPPPPMSLPVLLPGISSPVPGFAPSCPSPGASSGSLSTAAADSPLPPLRFGGCTPALPQYRNPRPTAPAPGDGLLPRRPLLSLGLLQVVLGCSVVALNFRALWLSSGPQVKNAYSFWAGSSVSHGRGPAAGQQPAPVPAGSVPVRAPAGRQRLLPAPAERWETLRACAPCERGAWGSRDRQGRAAVTETRLLPLLQQRRAAFSYLEVINSYTFANGFTRFTARISTG